MAQKFVVGDGLLVVNGCVITDTPHLVGLLWTKDRPDEETSP